jgi:hypothetical protein
VDEAGSEEAHRRRGGGRDRPMRHGQWVPALEANSSGRRGAGVDKEVHAGAGGGGRSQRARMPEVCGGEEEGERVGGGSARLGVAKSRAAVVVEDEGG